MTAVIYKNDEAFISATPNSTTYSSDTLEITLLAKNVTSARYVVDGVDKGSFIDNTKVIIGEGKNIGDTTKLTLTAKDEDGKDIEKTYTYTKGKNRNIVYIKLPSGWGEPYAYVYDDSTGTVKNNAAWPGVKMTKVGDNLYSYEVDSSIANPKVIFTDNKVQYPESGQDGLTLNGSMIYSDGQWQVYNSNRTYPVIKGVNVAVIELPSGWGEPYAYVYDDSTGTVKNNAAWPGVKMTKVRENLYAYEVPEGYTNPKVIFTDNKVQYPESGQAGLDVKGQMIYSDGSWKTYVATEDPIEGKTVFLKLPVGWGEPYAYVYEELTMKVKSNAAWPGVKMTKVADGLYKYEIPEGYTNPRVIFTDGSNQYPYTGTEGLLVTGNMIYSDGKWSNYTK